MYMQRGLNFRNNKAIVCFYERGGGEEANFVAGINMPARATTTINF